jgi:tetrahydromethanopterin S-methyltransferase subunit B
MANALFINLEEVQEQIEKLETLVDWLNHSCKYKFYDIFPTNVSAIDLSYDSSDTIEEFTVEFQVQYWTARR